VLSFVPPRRVCTFTRLSWRELAIQSFIFVLAHFKIFAIDLPLNFLSSRFNPDIIKFPIYLNSDMAVSQRKISRNMIHGASKCRFAKHYMTRNNETIGNFALVYSGN